jgi:hypothetical protein
MNKISLGVKEEISILDFFNFLIRHRKLILISSLSFALTALIYSLTMHTKFKSEIVFDLYRFSNHKIETPQMLLYRSNLPSFYSEEVVNACLSPESKLTPEKAREKLIQELKISITKELSYINLSFQSESKTKNKACLIAALKNIQEKELIEAKPFLDMKKNKLESMKKIKIELIKSILDIKNNPHLALTYYDLNKEILNYEMELSDPQTRVIYYIDEMKTREIPVLFGRCVITFLGFLIGGVFAIFYLAFKEYSQNTKYSV